MSKFCSMFSQILLLISDADFCRSVSETKAERHKRGFACWDQCVAMLFCQLARAHSLREICGGLASCEGRMQHLGLKKAPPRATLAYANEHRPWQLYETLFYKTQVRLSGELGGACKTHRLRFKNRLLSLDGTVIDLCIEVFDWAKFRQTKGAVKLHLLLDHDGCLPSYAVITNGNESEMAVARKIVFERGAIVVFDRGYVDYAWWSSLCDKGVYFVTRLKSSNTYEVIEERELPKGRHVLRDQTIRLTGRAAQRCSHLLRRVEIEVPETGETLVFLTNHLKFGATTVAGIYKERWQIELFFKAIKQNLKIKTFLGTTANAVKTQIWTALLVMLLLKYMQLKAKSGWSLANLIALLRMNLFVYRSLWAWLDDPWNTPPDIAPPVQERFAFN